jgi:hypothetical protein
MREFPLKGFGIFTCPADGKVQVNARHGLFLFLKNGAIWYWQE